MKAQKTGSTITKTFSLAIGVVAGLFLASTLYNVKQSRGEKQTPIQNRKLPEGVPDEFSLWI